jgi:hypothetical protein
MMAVGFDRDHEKKQINHLTPSLPPSLRLFRLSFFLAHLHTPSLVFRPSFFRFFVFARFVHFIVFFYSRAA